MKRMMMAAMLLIGMIPLMAQSFEFQYQSRSLDDGATVTITAEESGVNWHVRQTLPAIRQMG